MRLSEKEIKVLKTAAQKVWGANVKVRLFGSRTDDTKKGGDIDLLINPGRNLNTRELVLSKANFLSQLFISMGEQKIDVIIESPEKEIIFRFPKNLNLDDLQDLTDLFEYKELTKGTSTAQKDVDKLVKTIKKGRWERTQQHLDK